MHAGTNIRSIKYDDNVLADSVSNNQSIGAEDGTRVYRHENANTIDMASDLEDFHEVMEPVLEDF